MFPGRVGFQRTTPETANTSVGAAASLASAASESLHNVVHAPISARNWWNALGDLYGTGREGLGLVEDASTMMEKIKK